MAIPFFYETSLPGLPGLFTLSGETSKHCIQVLRMQPGETIALTDGMGTKYEAEIISADKKQTVVTLSNKVLIPMPEPQTSIAISFVKNPSRMEWFLEKATEIGIAAVYPLIAERTERTHFKADRWESIIVSAMLQSQQVWKTQLQEPVAFHELISRRFAGTKMIAHCEDDSKNSIVSLQKAVAQLILIGPEGDFSKEEITAALACGFHPVSLGITRLRTETAGIAAAVLLQNR